MTSGAPSGGNAPPRASRIATVAWCEWRRPPLRRSAAGTMDTPWAGRRGCRSRCRFSSLEDVYKYVWAMIVRDIRVDDPIPPLRASAEAVHPRLSQPAGAVTARSRGQPAQKGPSGVWPVVLVPIGGPMMTCRVSMVTWPLSTSTTKWSSPRGAGPWRCSPTRLYFEP